jgi:hypothetical protein
MATYNGMPLSSGGAPANVMGMNPGQSLAMEGFEQEINFDPDFQLYVLSFFFLLLFDVFKSSQ